jgi:annexin A7/11
MESDEAKDYAEKIFACLSTKKKEETILDVILNTDIDKRLEICNSYLAAYNRDLYADIKSKLSGQFKDAAIHLFLPPAEFMAKMIKKGLKGFSLDESMIYEIFTACNQEELKQIELSFRKETNKDLSKEIEKNFPFAIRKNLLNLLNIPRNVNESPNRVECEKWAQNLIDAGENNWVSNEDVFREIFILRSPEELTLIGRYYYDKTGDQLLDVVEKKLTNKVRNLLRELLYNVIIPQELFADKLNSALKSNNTALLNRILVARCQIDMGEIRNIYKMKYDNELRDDVIARTSGLYQKLLTYLVDYNS